MASLEQLRIFLAVYRHGSMTAAASSLHLSQPSVSAHLTALESEAGMPLFRRRARGVEPTPRGETLARAVAEHLDALAAVEERLRGGGMAETVVLGGPRDLLALRALPALTELVSDGLRLRLHLGFAEDFVSGLIADELDLAIAAHQPRTSELVYELMFSETLQLVCSPKVREEMIDRGLERDPRTVLADSPWLALDEDLTFIYDYCRSALAGWRPSIMPVATIADLRALATLARLGAGLTVLPNFVVEQDLAEGTLVEVIEPKEGPRQPIALAYRPAALGRPGVRAVRASLLVAAPAWALSADCGASAIEVDHR